MKINNIYLDNAATTPVYNEVADVMDETLRNSFYNPSSFYKPSMETELLIQKAREDIARSLRFAPEEIYFTSGATESNNTIVKGIVDKQRKNFNIITSQLEHPSIMEVFKDLESKGVDTRYIPVDRYGNLDLEWLEDNIDENTALVSVMAANNEIGTIMDLEKIRKIIDKKNPKAVFHADYVQAYLKTNDSSIDFRNAKPDAVTITAHKIHGPKGIGVLAVRDKVKFSPLLLGGGQENSVRAGTENVSGIVGLAKAVNILQDNVDENSAKLKSLKNKLLKGLNEIDDIVINTPNNSIPGLINVSINNIKAEVLLHMLETKGIYISAGSACATHKKDSYVHKALGLTKGESEGTIRISMSEFTTEEDIDTLLKELKTCVKTLRKVLGFKKK